MSSKRSRKNIEQDICGVCNSETPPDYDGKVNNWIECSCCAAWYHFSCVGVVSAEAKTNYFCPKCFKDSNLETVALKVSKSLMDSGDLVNAIGTAIEAAITSHMEKLWPTIENKIQLEVKNSTAPLVQRITELEVVVGELDKQLQLFKHQQQYNSRVNNIIVRGVSDSLRLEPIKIVAKIAEFIGFTPGVGDVMSAKKISVAANAKPKSSIFVVSFRDTTSKYSFLKSYYTAIKQKKYVDMSIFNIGGTYADAGKEGIYISEHMPKATLQIFLIARKLKRLNLICYYRFNRGFISIKINESDKFHIIKSLDQLEKLIPSTSLNFKLSNLKQSNVVSNSDVFTNDKL